MMRVRTKSDRLAIGLFSDSYPPMMDGVSLVVQGYASWMDRHDCDVSVITPWAPVSRDENSPRVVRYASVPVPGHRPYRLGLPRLDRNLGASLREIPLDLIHAHSPFSSGALALELARARRIPIVATMHSKYDVDIHKAVRVRWIADFIVGRIVGFYKQVDEVWVPNTATVRSRDRPRGHRYPVRWPTEHEEGHRSDNRRDR